MGFSSWALSRAASVVGCTGIAAGPAPVVILAWGPSLQRDPEDLVESGLQTMPTRHFEAFRLLDSFNLPSAKPVSCGAKRTHIRPLQRLHTTVSFGILLYLRKGVGGGGGQERGRRDASSQHAAITASVASNHDDRVQVHASTCRTRQPRTSGGEIFQNVLGPWFRRGLTRGPAADPGLLNILSHPCRASPTPRAQPGYLQHFRRMVDALHVSSSKKVAIAARSLLTLPNTRKGHGQNVASHYLMNQPSNASLSHHDGANIGPRPITRTFLLQARNVDTLRRLGSSSGTCQSQRLPRRRPAWPASVLQCRG